MMFRRITRDTVLFASGIAGFAHELTRQGAERPSILVLCAAMMGLPVFMRVDEKKGGERP